MSRRLRRGSARYRLIDTGSPTLRLREKPPLVVRLPEHDDVMRQAFSRYALTLPPQRRLLLERYRLQDVMFKVVGIAGVGTFCAIGLFVTADDEPSMLQIKGPRVPYSGHRPAQDEAARSCLTATFGALRVSRQPIWIGSPARRPDMNRNLISLIDRVLAPITLIGFAALPSLLMPDLIVGPSL